MWGFGGLGVFGGGGLGVWRFGGLGGLGLAFQIRGRCRVIFRKRASCERPSDKDPYSEQPAQAMKKGEALNPEP